MSRKDIWSEENDRVLAETVLDAIRTGKTQLVAFIEAEALLGRTAAACGFRWNSELRKQYETEIEQAKTDRAKNKKTAKEKENIEPDKIVVSISSSDSEKQDDPIQVLTHAFNLMKKEYNKLKSDYSNLQGRYAKLEKQLNELPNGEDLNILLKLLQHARNLGIMKENSAS